MSFKTNVINSFKQVKTDIFNFKTYVFEWFNLIITNQRKLLEKVKQLEQRVQVLENDKH